MTATDRLRALLDERGMEYETDDHMGFSETRWGCACAFQLAPGAGLVMAVSPEQAVEATLGREDCKLPETRIDHGSIEYNGVTEWRRCSACGAEVLAYPAHYCPSCGRKVVE